MDPGDARRPPVWPRRRRRWLRRVRLAAGAARAGGPEYSARALRHPDRGQRRKRQSRSARLHRRARRPHRRAVAGRVPGCGVRQLRSVLVYDVAARQSHWHAARARAARGRAFRHGQRHRRVELPHRAPAAGAGRGCGDRQHSVDALHAPRFRRIALKQARAAAQALGDGVHRKLPFVDGMQAVATIPTSCCSTALGARRCRSPVSTAFRRSERRQRVATDDTALVLSFRLPPGVDPAAAAQAVKQTLERDPPYGAKVTFDVESSMGGWNAPSTAPWLEARFSRRRRLLRPRCDVHGHRRQIPFMGMLSEKFPRTQFLVTGVLGPHSNAHGPNEFLDIATGSASRPVWRTWSRRMRRRSVNW